MEVAAGENLTGIAAIRKHQRVVGRAVQFDRSDVPHIFQGLAHRTVYLWYAAKAIRILYSAAIDVGLADLAFSKKSRQSLRNLNLAPVRSRLMNAHIILDRGSFQGLERHRAGQIRHVEQLFRATPADDAGGQCRLRAVEKSETLFRAKVQRSQA